MKKIIIAIAALVSLASCSDTPKNEIVIERYNMRGGFVSRDTVEMNTYSPRQVGDTVFLQSPGMDKTIDVIAIVRVK